MNKFLQLFVSGVSLGSIYALIALGFVIIFKATEVVNFAGGALVVVGTYFTARFHNDNHLNFWLAALGGVMVAVAVAVFVERVLVRPLRGRSVISIAVLTIGVDIILRTEINRRIGVNIAFTGDPWGSNVLRIGDITIAQTRVAAMIASLALIVVFFVWFKRSDMGVAMRAAAEDVGAAELMGIRPGRVSLVAWAIAGALAAVAGVFLVGAPSAGLDQLTAFTALRAFPAAILGGLDSTGGAVVGGIVIGLSEVLTQGYQSNLTFLGRGFHETMPYVVMIIVLLVRPTGLFGTRAVSRV
jgi:branched-chain amino acid transport system permease protein